MHRKCLLFSLVALLTIFALLPGCTRDGETTDTSSTPSTTYTNVSNQIAGVNPSSPSSLADIFKAAQDINKAKADGAVSEEEAGELDNELKGKFDAWTKATVDDIDPTKPESLKDFFDLQAVQGTAEYDKYVSPETKQYKEEQMTNKFNEWVKNRVDEIDPSDPNAIKPMFDLQVIQGTEKYDELATADTKNYKEEQLGQKLNEWVRNRVDEIDPTNPDDLKYFFWMQTIQGTDKYDEFATPETHEYKESEMKRKFNEWVENRVNDLDPDDPDFLKKLEMLRVIQLSDKYDKFIIASIHEWKENTLREKLDEYVRDLLSGLNPFMPTFWEDLNKLIEFQMSDIYQELCPMSTKQFKQTQLTGMLTQPLGPPPFVAGAYPLFEQSNVALDQTIMIVFNQPMEIGSVIAAIEITPEIQFSITPALEEPFIFLLDPTGYLKSSTDYTVTINQNAFSLAGIAIMETFECSFKTKETGGIPAVVATNPVDGAIGNMVGQPITITFNQSMSTTATESAINIYPDFEHSIVWSNNNTEAMIQSHAPLTPDTVYSVRIETDAISVDGIHLTDDYSFSFITGIRNLPQVIGVMTDTAQGNIPSNFPIQIVFDRSMDTQSVETMLTISPDIEYTITWYEADMVLRIQPESILQAGTTYTVTIPMGVISSFGLPMADDYEFNFTIVD